MIQLQLGMTQQCCLNQQSGSNLCQDHHLAAVAENAAEERKASQAHRRMLKSKLLARSPPAVPQFPLRFASIYINVQVRQRLSYILSHA